MTPTFIHGCRDFRQFAAPDIRNGSRRLFLIT